MNDIQPPSNKICPYCFLPLSLEATTCFSCKKTVGKINKHGMARKPVNYWSYFVFLAACIVFIVYIYWAFF